jgi:hypothetical protein
MADSKEMMNVNSYIVFFVIGAKRDNEQWSLSGLVKSLDKLKKGNKWLTIPTDTDEVEAVVLQLRMKGLVAYHEAENYKIALTGKGRKIYTSCIEPGSTPSTAVAPIQFLDKGFPKTYKRDIVAHMLWAEPDKRVGIVEDVVARQMGCSKRSVERGVLELREHDIVEIYQGKYSFAPSLESQDAIDLDDVPFGQKLVKEEMPITYPSKLTSKIDLQLTTPDFKDKLTLLARINHTDVETMALACFNAGYAAKVRESLEPLLKGM